MQQWAPASAVEGDLCWSSPFELGSKYSEPEEWPVIALLRGQVDEVVVMKVSETRCL